MIDLVLTLAFSTVMLFFMLYPAMKIVEFLEERFALPKRLHTPLTIVLIIFFSLSIGLFLKYA